MSNYREKKRLEEQQREADEELNLRLSEQAEDLLGHLAGELCEKHLGAWFPDPLEPAAIGKAVATMISSIEGEESAVLKKLATNNPQYYKKRYADVIADKAYDSLAQGALERILLESLTGIPKEV